jgi:acetyl esterase
MHLDHAVLDFLATKPDSGSPDTSVLERRATIRRASDQLFGRFSEPAADVHAAETHWVDSPRGAVRVRVYRPSDERGLPLHVFLHGGGFWLGSVDELIVDATCRERSIGAECIVVSVDYRLSPEHPFPVPLEDCYAALVWAHRHVDELGADPNSISIGGVSAGANLAAAVALAARDRQGPRLCLQLLEVPPLDLTLRTMRSSGVGDNFGITVAEMELCTGLYLGGAPIAGDPLVSPLLAPNLAGLPAARIMTAEFDPLRSDGERYAGRLESAAVSVEHRNYPGAVHGSIALTATWAPARTWRNDVIESLRRAHRPVNGATSHAGGDVFGEQASPTERG